MKMAAKQQDCYFFYYSSCSKGSLCPYRHCEAAVGSEVTCAQWLQGECTRPNCWFRHMVLEKNRSTIPCYWEDKPSGCTKPHCPFLHSNRAPADQSVAGKPAIASRLGVQPMKTSSDLFPENTARAVLAPASMAPPKHIAPVAPSALMTIKPVVINACEESDQESLNGTPVKEEVTKSTAIQETTPSESILDEKVPSLDEILREDALKAKRQLVDQMGGQPDSQESQDTETLGLKSLEEILKEKALASMRRKMQEKANVPASAEDSTQITETKLSSKKVELRSTSPVRKIKPRLEEEEDVGDQHTDVRKILSSNKSSLKQVSGRKLTRRIIVADEEAETDQSRTSILSRLGRRVESKSNSKVDAADRPEADADEVDSNVEIGERVQSKVIVKESESQVKVQRKVPKLLSNSDLEEICQAKVPKKVKSSPATSPSKDSASEEALAKRNKSKPKVNWRLGSIFAKEETPPKELKLKTSKDASRLRIRRPQVKKERGIYRPPGANKVTGGKSPELVNEISEPVVELNESPVKVAVDIEKQARKPEKKSSGWGVKTFSEIMAEKRKQREEQNSKQSESKPVKSASPLKSNQVDASDISAVKKRNFTPISFTDEKEMPNSNKIASDEPSAKRTRKFNPVSSLNTESQRKLSPVKNLAEDRSKLGSSAVPKSGRVKSNLDVKKSSCQDQVGESSTSSATPRNKSLRRKSDILDLSTPDSVKPISNPLRLDTINKDVTAKKSVESLSSTPSLHRLQSEDSILEEAMNNFLREDDLAVKSSLTLLPTPPPADSSEELKDDDSLLREMEELLGTC